ncbi:MAG TPA: DUF6600 domain-containing protein [Pyrinomonadaceae bacterium]|nr:DUF6600 domain-containing protein [Pyrinomonadaceae bacterium]
MRDSKTLLTFALLLLSILTTTAANPYTFAATPTAFDEEEEGYEETARVVRVSMLSGDVSLRRAGSDKWEKASLNLPLVEGDRLATGANARLEIQIDARNFLRLGEYATLDIVTLRDEGIALSLPEGTATLRLAGFDAEREYFEIDAPKTTLAAEQKGAYRLDVAQNGNVRVTVREGGRARLYSETSGFTLRDGRSAELTYNNNNASEDGDWELSAARTSDSWDTWVDERERFLAARLRYDGRERYYDKYVWGAEELDSYGDWVSSSEYGYVWRPHTTIINNYHDWAPYRYGSWRWCPPYGWTWVGDEPWGWAPYHYGRWVYVNNYWGWAPRGYASYGRRSWWRPALVAFVNINIGGGGHYGGDHVAWYPLGYHQRDPRSNFYRRSVRRALDRQRVANLDRVNPIYQRAVTTLPAREFGKSLTRGKPAPRELAARAITTDPLSGKLPYRPSDSELVKGGSGGANGIGITPAARERRRGDTLVIRNPDDPSRTILERKTGAASRKPGLALDGELRRGRIYNNREPRSSKVERGGGGVKVGDGSGGERAPDRSAERGNNGERGTGAFERPARGIRMQNGADGANVGAPAVKRPERQVDPDAGTFRPRPNVTDERMERKVRTAERPNADGSSATPAPEYRRERPMPRPEARDERAKPVERERPAPEVYRPRPEVREERKTAREERTAPRPERPAPPREERSAPREERSAPREERRSSPPQQREERRADPPREQRSAPPPSPVRSKSMDTKNIDN